MKNFFKFLIFLVIFLGGVVGLAVYWTFYKPLPDYEATESYEALERPVDIHWDSHGIPHIYAQNKQDLYFSVGYVHAQDRLWQMTLAQLAAQGRFAEFFGPDLVPLDKHQRILDIWQTAQKIEKQMPDSTRRLLQAYADGVNRYVGQHDNKLPIQFTLADMEPLEWTVTHSVALSRLLAWELNVSWWSEASYGLMASKLSPEKMQEIMPRYSSNAPRSLSAEQTRQLSGTLYRFFKQEQDVRSLRGMEGTHVGSNAWVVDASKTRTGFPLLGGDPHLGLNSPGKWYELHLHVDGKNLSGATTPGSPIVILGQNDFLGWSLTNMMADDTDFFVEQINPNDRGKYVADSTSDSTAQYRDFRIRKEVIEVKDAPDTILRKRYTKHGPIISDIFPGDTGTGRNRVIAMKWTGHTPSHETSALLTMNWAESIGTFQEGVRHFEVPGQNVIYGDRTGNIAMFSAARLPQRDHNPILFRKGWDPSYDWQDPIPFEQMPYTINPERGWIANANNKITTDTYPHYLGTFWEPPSRMQRIRQYLTRYDTLTPSLFKQMQNDSYSFHAREVTNIILPILARADGNQFAAPITYLKNWNFEYQQNSTAATLLDVFFLKLSRNTLADELGTDLYEKFIHLESRPTETMDRFLRRGSTFFDDAATPDTETRAEMVRRSMSETLEFLKDSLGTEPFEWRWEQVHTLSLDPPLFGRAARQPDAPWALELIVNNLMRLGPYPVKGHGMSISNGQYKWNNPYNMVLGPSIRRIVDFSDMSRTESIVPTGQSENPISAHYGDQTQRWLNGSYKYVYQDSSLFEETTHKTMRLNPASRE